MEDSCMAVNLSYKDIIFTDTYAGYCVKFYKFLKTYTLGSLNKNPIFAKEYIITNYGRFFLFHQRTAPRHNTVPCNNYCHNSIQVDNLSIKKCDAQPKMHYFCR